MNEEGTAPSSFRKLRFLREERRLPALIFCILSSLTHQLSFERKFETKERNHNKKVKTAGTKKLWGVHKVWSVIRCWVQEEEVVGGDDGGTSSRSDYETVEVLTPEAWNRFGDLEKREIANLFVENRIPSQTEKVAIR